MKISTQGSGGIYCATCSGDGQVPRLVTPPPQSQSHSSIQDQVTCGLCKGAGTERYVYTIYKSCEYVVMSCDVTAALHARVKVRLYVRHVLVLVASRSSENSLSHGEYI